jgi:hypothetical protein
MIANYRDYIELGTTIERDFQSQANTLSQRVSTWVLAGNGAGLLLCFNALVQRQICNWGGVQPLAALFLFGMIGAFSSVVFSMRKYELAAARMLTLNSAFRTAGIHIGTIESARKALEDLEGHEVERTDLIAVRDEQEAAVKRITAEIETLTADSAPEEKLQAQSNWTLVSGIVCFGLALFLAIAGIGLQGALCAAVEG